ncbi:MAG: hypothetical protein LBM94_03910 [Propionibacteriaceae bacterium]|jgi:hypothetical protein|nr:hypothetical protein [Propionibacteriaceae bacterium]
MTETPQTPQAPENAPQSPVEPAAPVAIGAPTGAGNPYAAEYTAAIPVQPWGAPPAAQAIQGETPGQLPQAQQAQLAQAQQWQPAQQSQAAQPVFNPTPGQWQQAPQPAYGQPAGQWQQPGVPYQYAPQPAAPAQPSAAAAFFKESEAFSGFREVRKNKFGSERFWSSILRIIGWVMFIVFFVLGFSSLLLAGQASYWGGAMWGTGILAAVSSWGAGVLILTGCMVAANIADDIEASRGLQSESNVLLERIAANTEKPAPVKPEATGTEDEELASSSLL